MKRARVFRLVRITWADAFTMTEWMTLDEIYEDSKSTDCEVTEVGWLLKETKEYVIIASQFSKAGNWGNITKIPKSWLTKIDELEVKS